MPSFFLQEYDRNKSPIKREEQGLRTHAIYSTESFNRIYIICILESYATQITGIYNFHYLIMKSFSQSNRNGEIIFTFSAVLWPTPRMDLASA